MADDQMPTPPPQGGQINLNLTDIADAVKIIDYASEQGAYKGWANIRQILLVRDRLEAFVSSAQVATEANNDAIEGDRSADETPPRMPWKTD